MGVEKWNKNKGSSDIPYGFTNPNSRTFGLGWLGGFDEIGCSDFKGNEKFVHPEISYCFHHTVLSFKFFPSSYKCDIPIGRLSVRNKFYG